ncbi:hypothetical protein Bca4012_043006 [Brassica carinata]
MGVGVSAAATTALTAVMSNQTMALVDERMSTEGRGLPFGLSNNLCLASPSPSSQEGSAHLFKMSLQSNKNIMGNTYMNAKLDTYEN